jgi:tetratricopeptide (TPR) repeat protein
MRITFSILSVLMTVWILLASCQNNGTKVENQPSRTDSLANPVAAMEKSIQTYPDSFLLRAKLADLQEENGQIDQAMVTIEQGLQRDSTVVILHNRRASLMLAKGDTASAIKGLLRSLSYAPEQTDIHVELGFLYAAQKNRNTLVVADFLLSQADQPQLQSQARYMKGIYYTNIGDKTNALQQFNECIFNDYTFKDAYMEKGILLFNDKKYADAQKVFEKVLAISNTHAEAYFWTGKCLEALNRHAEAIDYYKKTIGLDDQFTEASEAIERLAKQEKK